MTSTVNTTQEKPIWDLFFTSDKPEVMSALSAVLTRDPSGIVASYVLGKENPFGPAEWKKYFGVDVGEAPKLGKEFYAWWFGPDPVDPTKQCCETHLPPVFRPAGMSLKKLGELVKAPKEGHPSQYEFQSKALIQNENTQAGPACWLVLRKDVLERNQFWRDQKQYIRTLNAKTGAAYEEEPSAIDLATVVFARHVWTGERYFNNDTEMENGWMSTYSRTKETVQASETLGPVVVGGFSKAGLCVNIDAYFNGFIGIGALRKF